MVTKKSVLPAGNRTPYLPTRSLRLLLCDSLLNSEHNIVTSLTNIIQFHFSVRTNLPLAFFTFGNTAGASNC